MNSPSHPPSPEPPVKIPAPPLRLLFSPPPYGTYFKLGLSALSVSPLSLGDPRKMAVVAVRRLQLHDFYELVPYAAAFAAVPTLACAAGREPLPPWPILPLTHSSLLANFTFTADNLKLPRARWWTLFTSAFCHSDAAHRDRNLVNLLLCGLQLAPELGRFGLALTFLGGHAAAALNARGVRLQLERFLDARTGRLAPSWLSGKAAELWSTAAPPTVLGGSAGLFAMLGVDCCIKLREALSILRRWRDDAEPPVMELLRLTVHMAPILSLVLSEHRSLRAGASISVGHAAHLTGFAWGVATFGAAGLCRRFGAARRSAAAAPANSGDGGQSTRPSASRPSAANFGAGSGGRRLGSGSEPPAWRRSL